jgi:hypothetical protein
MPLSDEIVVAAAAAAVTEQHIERPSQTNVVSRSANRKALLEVSRQQLGCLDAAVEKGDPDAKKTETAAAMGRPIRRAKYADLARVWGGSQRGGLPRTVQAVVLAVRRFFASAKQVVQRQHESGRSRPRRRPSGPHPPRNVRFDQPPAPQIPRGVGIEGRNPAENRRTEQAELKCETVSVFSD